MESTSPRTFRCVPFDPNWAIAGTKYDLKAIYRRPRRTIGEYDEITPETNAEGLPLWDLTTPLPLRRHSDWTAKGYEYVTLADMESLEKAAPSLRAKGLRVQDFVQHPQLGPWNPKLYAAVANVEDQTAFAELVALIEKFGVDTVEQIRGVALPAALRARFAPPPPADVLAQTDEALPPYEDLPIPPAQKPARKRKQAEAV